MQKRILDAIKNWTGGNEARRGVGWGLDACYYMIVYFVSAGLPWFVFQGFPHFLHQNCLWLSSCTVHLSVQMTSPNMKHGLKDSVMYCRAHSKHLTLFCSRISWKYLLPQNVYLSNVWQWRIVQSEMLYCSHALSAWHAAAQLLSRHLIAFYVLPGPWSWLLSLRARTLSTSNAASLLTLLQKLCRSNLAGMKAFFLK